MNGAQWSPSRLLACQEQELFGINDFLTLTEGQAAQPMLMSAHKETFREAAPASE